MFNLSSKRIILTAFLAASMTPIVSAGAVPAGGSIDARSVTTTNVRCCEFVSDCSNSCVVLQLIDDQFPTHADIISGQSGMAFSCVSWMVLDSPSPEACIHAGGSSDLSPLNVCVTTGEPGVGISSFEIVQC
ncbi:hypothetical protein F5884DRAFT_863039 [Xylogone sp. PMI_703]|nr:hypothetical protein F5884DRAFT_863039 [Xylogone sp. PMI_703]